MGGRVRWWVTYHKIVIKILIFYARRRIKFELKFSMKCDMKKITNLNFIIVMLLRNIIKQRSE